jgi:hypothetical protein
MVRVVSAAAVAIHDDLERTERGIMITSGEDGNGGRKEEGEGDPHDYLSSLHPPPVDDDLYNSKIPTNREEDFMEILTHLMPSRRNFSEFYRLDLLLDDYLQHTHHFNQHPDILQTTGNGPGSKMSTFSSSQILILSHRVRLDLTALLTASILFPLPKTLFQETLEQLLIVSSPSVGWSQEEILDLMALPLFVKTGIVSLCRRICFKELQEYELNGYLSVKPSPPPLSSPPASLHSSASSSTSCSALPPRDANGFRFLSFLRLYLNAPIQRSHPPDPNSLPFNDMERDLLKYLPDIPTLSSCPSPSSAAYRDWVSLTARHTIILMSRLPTCPSLTRPQRSIQQETLLKQLKPLLVAAEMTYEDLEITTTGPMIDGRTTATTTVLGFGSGVPNGRASGLKWNASGATRDYLRPWVPTPNSQNLIIPLVSPYAFFSSSSQLLSLLRSPQTSSSSPPQSKRRSSRSETPSSRVTTVILVMETSPTLLPLPP